MQAVLYCYNYKIVKLYILVQEDPRKKLYIVCWRCSLTHFLYGISQKVNFHLAEAEIKCFLKNVLY